MKRKIIFFLFILLLVSVSYFFSKPFKNDYKNATNVELENIDFKKDVELSSSKSLIYTNGVLRLTFNLKVKNPTKTALINIKINNKFIETKELLYGKETTLTYHLQKGDLFILEIVKNNFNKDDVVDVKMQYRKDITLSQDILLIVFIILFGYYAFLKNKFITFSIIYINYLLLLYAQQIGFGSINFETNIAYLFLSICIFYIYFFINGYIRNKFINIIFRYTILLTITLVPLLVVVYGVSTHNQISDDMFNALFQTNINEAYAYSVDMFNKEILLSVFLYLILMFYLIVKSLKEVSIITYEESIPFLVVIVTLIALFNTMSLYSLLYYKYDAYTKEMLKFKTIAQLRVENSDAIDAFKTKKGETYVVVIGESQNKYHMGVYDYFRNTTPLVQQEDIVKFDFAYSNNVYTTAVLSYSLTQANSINKIDYYKAYSIVDIVKKAGFKTYWLSNQVLKGGWDNVISVIANKCDKLVGINNGFGKTVNTQHYDEALIPYLKEILENKTQENKIIFIHLMGNHNRYSDRYPKKFEKYDNYLQYEEFGNIVDMNDITDFINSYDNSMLYNDYVVDEIIKSFHDETGALLYFADHSEGVDYRLAHTPDDFKYEMCDIPMYIYMTKKYKKRYPNKVKNIQMHKEQLFNNAFVYDTLIGMMDINTTLVEKKYDISSKAYKFLAQDAYTLHGKKLYTSQDNYEYIKNINTNFLEQEHIYYGIKNYESIAQIYEALQKGATSLTIILIQKDHEFYIKVGSKEFLFKNLIRFLKQKHLQPKIFIKYDNTLTDTIIEKIVRQYTNSMFIVDSDTINTISNHKRIVLAINNEAVYQSIVSMDKKSLSLLARKYHTLLYKYKIKNLYIGVKNLHFINSSLNKDKIETLLIDTNENICDKNMLDKIKNNNTITKKMIFDLNYCTIFAQEKKYRSMGL